MYIYIYILYMYTYGYTHVVNCCNMFETSWGQLGFSHTTGFGSDPWFPGPGNEDHPGELTAIEHGH